MFEKNSSNAAVIFFFVMLACCYVIISLDEGNWGWWIVDGFFNG